MAARARVRLGMHDTPTRPDARVAPDLATIRVLIQYTDWSNDRLLAAAEPLEDARLDRELEVGPGTLRRALLHILSGEQVWLRRWRGEAETTWPDERERATVAQVRTRMATNRNERDDFLDTLAAGPTDLGRVQPYRDSKGSLFRATLGDMLIQGVMHSKHHQAQAVNMIRRLGGEWPELDYMYRVRRS